MAPSRVPLRRDIASPYTRQHAAQGQPSSLRYPSAMLGIESSMMTSPHGLVQATSTAIQTATLFAANNDLVPETPNANTRVGSEHPQLQGRATPRTRERQRQDALMVVDREEEFIDGAIMDLEDEAGATTDMPMAVDREDGAGATTDLPVMFQAPGLLSVSDSKLVGIARERGRTIPRITGPYTDVFAMLVAGVWHHAPPQIRGRLQQIGCSTTLFARYVYAYNHVVKVPSDLHDALTFRTGFLNTAWHIMNMSSLSSRSSDVKNVSDILYGSGGLLSKINDGLPNVLYKTQGGYGAPKCFRLLAPPGMPYTPENVLALKNDVAVFEGIPVDGLMHRAFSWRDYRNDPNNYYDGIYQSNLLILVMIYIYAGPRWKKALENLGVIPVATCRYGRKGNAKIAGLTSVTPYMVAYCTMLIQHALTDKAMFYLEDVDNSESFHRVLNWFEAPSPMTNEHKEKALEWLNDRLFWKRNLPAQAPQAPRPVQRGETDVPGKLHGSMLMIDRMVASRMQALNTDRTASGEAPSEI